MQSLPFCGKSNYGRNDLNHNAVPQIHAGIYSYDGLRQYQPG